MLVWPIFEKYNLPTQSLWAAIFGFLGAIL